MIKDMMLLLAIATKISRAAHQAGDKSSATVAGIDHAGYICLPKQRLRHRHDDKKRHEQTDFAENDQHAGQCDGTDGMLDPAFFGHRSAISVTKPLSSIILPNSAPCNNTGTNCAMKLAADQMKVCTPCVGSASPTRTPAKPSGFVVQIAHRGSTAP